MADLASIALLLAMAAAVEYLVHRFKMHGPGDAFFESHAVEHHRDGKSEPHHMGFSWTQAFQYWLATSLLWLPLSFVSWLVIPFWILFLLWWKYAWDWTHRLCHGDQRYWGARVLVPWYHLIANHHLLHHRHPSKNYGGLFWFTDLLFGTKVNRIPVHGQRSSVH